MNTAGKLRARISNTIVAIVAVIIFGTFLTAKYQSTYSPAAQNKHRLLKEAQPEDISAIVIEPYTTLSLTNRRIVVSDRETIARILTALRSAHGVSPNHPAAKWIAILRIQHKTGDYGGEVENTSNNQGVLFWFTSDIQGGWNLGSYRVDALGAILEDLINKK